MITDTQTADNHIAIASAVVESVLSQVSVIHNPFRIFLLQYVNAIVNAMKRLGQIVSHDAIVAHGINIEPLIKEYMLMLAGKHDPDFELSVKVIHSDLEQTNFRSIFDKTEMFDRDLYVVSLWHYCKNRNLFDSVASTLARTYEYNFRYYRELVDAFLSIHLNQVGTNER